MIVIVDYGVGNLRSVERALNAVGAKAVVTSNPKELESAEGIILPGVGAFAPAIERLNQNGLGQQIVDLVRAGKPLLGVCLGYQLLYEQSEEGGFYAGLGLLSGRVLPVPTAIVPVMGWCRVRQTQPSSLWSGVPDNSYFYFAHSYTPNSLEKAYGIGVSDHAPLAVAERDHIWGTQFHPEKSGEMGLKIYANFCRSCGAEDAG